VKVIKFVIDCTKPVDNNGAAQPVLRIALRAWLVFVLVAGLVGGWLPVARAGGGLPAVSKKCPLPAVWNTSAKGCVDANMAVPDRVKVVVRSKSSVRVSWRTVVGAKGYRVYQGNKKNGRFKVVATIPKGGQHALTVKGLKPDKVKYFRVRAYRSISQRRVWSQPSWWVSMVPVKAFGGGQNASVVKVPGGSMTMPRLGYGWDPLIGMSVRKRYSWGYIISDNEVRCRLRSGAWLVRVTEHCSFYSLGPVGTAQVEIVAHNGVSVVAPMVVADYARPKEFNMRAYAAYDPTVEPLLTTFKYQITELAAWTMEQDFRTARGCYKLSDDDSLIEPTPVPDPRIRQMMLDLLLDYPYELELCLDGRVSGFMAGHEHYFGDKLFMSWVSFEPHPRGPHMDPLGPLSAYIAPHWNAGATDQGRTA
jgi:hypothetical protein